MPDTFDAARPRTIDSEDLARIAAWLDDCPAELREAWEDMKDKPKTIAPPNLEVLMAADYAYVQTMKSFYERQSELYAADEKTERQTLAHEQAAWRQSRGRTR